MLLMEVLYSTTRLMTICAVATKRIGITHALFVTSFIIITFAREFGGAKHPSLSISVHIHRNVPT